MAQRMEVERFLNRRLQAAFPSMEKVTERISQESNLVFYFGIDPTGPELHLGHTVSLLILRQLIEWGHQVILLIGDFTAQIGDPTDKSAARQPLTREQVDKNSADYLNQVSKLLKPGSYTVRHNSEWLAQLNFEEVIKLAAKTTVQQMLARDMFQERIKAGRPIGLHEFLYPLMQGYDAVAMRVDGEVGGSDQTFNMMMGRDLEWELIQKDKIVLATKFLEDPVTGKKLMSKSEGNYIALNGGPEQMFGGVMALGDNAILPLFQLSTTVDDEVLADISKRLTGGENPIISKKALAYEVVRMYHGEAAAQQAQDAFESTFSKGQVPEEMPGLAGADTELIDFLIKHHLVESRSEAKRLIEQKGVKINGVAASSWETKLKAGDVIKLGSHRFVRVN